MSSCSHATLLTAGITAMTAIVGATMIACSGNSAPRSEESTAAPAAPTLQGPTMADSAPMELPGLHNVVAYDDGYYSGSVPHGEAGFDSLQAMGVKTIISVDGTIPEVEAAEARGIRYIHLPIGYNGFDEQRKLELARASQDAMADGPVYVHCHHGKHRSAGAAGAVAVSLGWATPEEMIERMHVSGTSEHYTGLYACTAESTLIPAATLAAVPGDFPSVSRPTGMVKGMVEVSHAYEHLQWVRDADWKVPAQHPDLVPAAEAGKLADLLRFLADDDASLRKPPDFRELMLDNWKNAADLEEMMITGASEEELGAQFKLVAASCKACHTKYRD